MYAYAAMNLMSLFFLAIAAMLTAFNLPPIYSAFYCALMFVPLFPYLFISAADNHGDYTIPATGLAKVSIWIVLVFAVIYWKNGLIISGEYQKVLFTDALYFSVTTWTTLGYGDFSPPQDLRLITSIQALLGYIAMGMLVALLSLWLPERMKSRLNVHQHNRRLHDQRSKVQTSE
jgi:hypothetical protein